MKTTIKHLCGLTMSMLMVSFLAHCGLPSLTEVDIAPTRPEVIGYYDGTNILLEISGNYPVEYFPDFNGFNIYFADNNEQTNIYKRAIYQSDYSDLPTSRASNIINEPLKITLADRFIYRLTDTSDEDDRMDEINDTNSGLTGNDTFFRIFHTYDRFSFIVRPLYDYKEADRSDTLDIYLPKIENDSVFELTTANPSEIIASPLEVGLSNTNVFNLSLSRGTGNNFTIAAANNDPNIRMMFLSAQNIERGCYQTFPQASSSAFIEGPLPLRPRSMYIFTNTMYTDYQYRFYVKSIDGTELSACTAYEKY